MMCPDCLVEMEFEDEEKRGCIFVCPDCGREIIRSWSGKRLNVRSGLLPINCVNTDMDFMEDEDDESLAAS